MTVIAPRQVVLGSNHPQELVALVSMTSNFVSCLTCSVPPFKLSSAGKDAWSSGRVSLAISVVDVDDQVRVGGAVGTREGDELAARGGL